jgi:hypothetical protein
MAQHIGFETRSRCIYDSHRCSYEPIYYLLMGCLNQHIGEGAICLAHSKLWIELYNQQGLACKDCGLDLAAYLIFPARELV